MNDVYIGDFEGLEVYVGVTGLVLKYCDNYYYNKQGINFKMKEVND